jgi:hypothetical protein
MEVYDENLLKRWNDIPKFDVNACSTVTYVVEITEHIYWYKITQDDESTQLFLASLDKKHMNLMKNYCISMYLTILIREFLTHCGLKSQQFEEMV